jgi:hypothetical protein
MWGSESVRMQKKQRPGGDGRCFCKGGDGGGDGEGGNSVHCARRTPSPPKIKIYLP